MKKILFGILLFIFVTQVKAYTKAPIDITNMSLIEIKECLDKGIITSEQLVNLYLERIVEYNDLFNAIRVINESALDEAKNFDKLRLEGACIGRLCGVPILVKTNIIHHILFL